MIRYLPLFALLAITGCHDKAASIVPTAPSVVIPITPVASCAPFTQVFTVQVDMSGPNLTSVSPVLPYELQERQGDGSYQRHQGLGLHFNHSYQIRGQVAGCWSNWFPFSVGPANPDASAGTPAPVPVPCEWKPDARVCR